MKKLIELVREFDLNKTDKHTAHAYIEHFYQEFFDPYRNRELNVLDNNKSKKFKDVLSERIIVTFGDAYTEEVVDSLPSFDIIIDDGPHTIESQIKCLEFYLPKLNDGGVILIEDIQKYEYIETLEEKYKELGGDMEVEFYDLRNIKRRYDDLIVVFAK